MNKEQQRKILLSECDSLGLSREEIIECANFLKSSASQPIKYMPEQSMKKSAMFDIADFLSFSSMLAMLGPPALGALGGLTYANLTNTPYTTGIAKQMETAQALDTATDVVREAAKRKKRKEKSQVKRVGFF